MNAILSSTETLRYARQIVLRGFGGEGQRAIKAARVLVIGAGGLGSPIIEYLSGAGVGVLGIVDNDRVALSNLHRQVVHATASVGRLKIESASDFVRSLNPFVEVETHGERVDDGNARDLIAAYDVVVDGSDNLSTRWAIACAAAETSKALVAGAVNTFDGFVTTFVPSNEQWLQRFERIFPPASSDRDTLSCEATGVLGPAAGVIGTLMAMETIKLITGIGTPLARRLLLYDGLTARFSEVAF